MDQTAHPALHLAHRGLDHGHGHRLRGRPTWPAGSGPSTTDHQRTPPCHVCFLLQPQRHPSTGPRGTHTVRHLLGPLQPNASRCAGDRSGVPLHEPRHTAAAAGTADCCRWKPGPAFCSSGRCVACSAGQCSCVRTCPTGLTLCGHECDHPAIPPTAAPAGTSPPHDASAAGPAPRSLPLFSNNDNDCGTCGNVCPPNTFCEGVQCVCRTPWFDCSGVCKNLSSDPQNCGACGHVCSPGPPNSTATCTNGVCGWQYNPGFTQCGSSCVNLSNDLGNCGSCGHACSPTFICSNGSCVCPPGQTNCSGVCRNLLTDA